VLHEMTFACVASTAWTAGRQAFNVRVPLNLRMSRGDEPW
jgi:hypothetical protein